MLCDIMEASTTDSIIPFLTTHIVVDKVTPAFKTQLNQLYSKAVEGHSKSGTAVGRGAVTTMLNFQTVSIDWLRQCLLQEQVLPCENYKPEVLEVNGQHSGSSQRSRFAVKQNLFLGRTFAVRKESYKDPKQVAHMEQVIIERGGRVIDDISKCMYLLQEDGHSSGWD